jgi:dipeptidyl aminopeptidase/acylaminoacyl peptidase
MAMRPLWPALALLALLVATAGAPARAQEQPNNLVVVDRDQNRVPPDLLPPDEVERITQLQRVVETVPFSPVSPDDRTVLLLADDQIAFLDLASGDLTPLNPEAFGNYAPLPLLGTSQFSWLDADTLGALAIDFAANRPEDNYVKLLISRDTLEVRAEPITLPSGTGLVSAAPNLDRYLLVVLPPAPEGEGEAQGRAQVRIRPDAPVAAPGARIPMPPALRARVERAAASPAFGRLWLMQDGAAANVAEVEPEQLDLVLFERGGTGTRYVTTTPAASLRLGDAWTADSARLAISLYGLTDPQRDRPDRDGGLISEEVYRDVTGNMPPSINPIIQSNNTYVVDFNSGVTRLLRPDPRVGAPLLGVEAWGPDNQTLLVQAYHPARLRGRTFPIYTPQFSERSSFRFYDLELRETGRLESDLFSGGLASNANATFLSPDELVVRGMRGTERHPYYYNRVSGELRNLADRAGSYVNIFSTNRSRQIVFMYSSYTQPPDIYRMGWDGSALSRLTWLNEELRVTAGIRQDPVSFTLRNGQRRTGVLVQPADAPFPPRNARIVVWQEGGPGVAMMNRWASNVENPYGLLPPMGIAVLITPVAGRPGYTAGAFNALADGGNFGAVDIDEQAEIVGQMIRSGWTSRGKVGITGCSYGGYFAIQSVVRHPDLYAAANPQCALVDVTTEWTRGFDRLVQYLEGLPPFVATEEYRRDSPVYNAGAIKAAMLTFHGSEDYLPVVLNENLHLQLVNRGVPARMVKFVGEGHGLRDEANQAYAAQEQLAWFRTHLAP